MFTLEEVPMAHRTLRAAWGREIISLQSLSEMPWLRVDPYAREAYERRLSAARVALNEVKLFLDRAETVAWLLRDLEVTMCNLADLKKFQHDHVGERDPLVEAGIQDHKDHVQFRVKELAVARQRLVVAYNMATEAVARAHKLGVGKGLGVGLTWTEFNKLMGVEKPILKQLKLWEK